jgi:hypothetical protein
MPPEVGHLIGQPPFEVARGILMEVCGFSADEAMRAISESADRTGDKVESLVAVILLQPALAEAFCDQSN